MDRKYKITYSGKVTGRIPNYALSLRVRLKDIFPETGWYGKEESDHVLHCISSLIDGSTFEVRSSQYRGDIPKRIISNDCLKVFNLGDEKVILTVPFTPLETRNQQYDRYG